MQRCTHLEQASGHSSVLGDGVWAEDVRVVSVDLAQASLLLAHLLPRQAFGGGQVTVSAGRATRRKRRKRRDEKDGKRRGTGAVEE